MSDESNWFADDVLMNHLEQCKTAHEAKRTINDLIRHSVNDAVAYGREAAQECRAEVDRFMGNGFPWKHALDWDGGLVSVKKAYQKQINVAGAKAVQEVASAAPEHYRKTIEPLVVIRDQLGEKGTKAFALGNVIKYVMRSKHKGGDKDLIKALHYLMMYLGVKKETILEVMGEVNK